MSETPTGTDCVELTEDEKRALNIPLVDTHSTNLYAAVESIVAARVAALTAEREELRTSLDYWVELWKKAANGVIGLQADLSEARAEADELRSSLEASHAEIAGLHSAWSERDSELAAANTRCAELERDCTDLRELADASGMVESRAIVRAVARERERDAALARIAELGAEKDGAYVLLSEAADDIDAANARADEYAKWLQKQTETVAALQATLDRVTALADSRMAGLRGFIVVKELVDALGGSYDYTGCGQWDGTPGAGYCCDLPVGHAGPHHADHHWPRAALTPEGKPQ